MIVKQTTTLIFEYPQDYLQEQEWCKTKEDRWIHKGTDTLGAVYENTISYSIGQPSNVDKDINVRSKDEQTDCTEALTLLWIKNMVTDEEFYRIDARLKCINRKE